MFTTEFTKKLTGLLNRGSMENGSNTPDFILAEFMADCLLAFDRAVVKRDQWYGIELRPGWRSESELTEVKP